MAHQIVPVSALALIIALAACDAGAAEDAGVSAAAPADQTAVVDAPPSVPAADEAFSLTAADLDAYAAGMNKEIEMLRAAADRAAAATGPADSLAAISAALPSQTEPEAARAAGIPVERYRSIKETVSGVLGAREMGAAMQTQMSGIDTAGLDDAAKAQMRDNMAQMEAAWGDPYKDLAPEAATALRARTDELAARRAEYMRLLFAMGR